MNTDFEADLWPQTGDLFQPYVSIKAVYQDGFN